MIIDRTENNELICPKCEGAYLHQEKVEVIFRDHEDGDGTITSVNRSRQKISRIKSEGIPKRRDFLQIFFHCEQCSAEPRLQLTQHKGTTLMEWIY